MDWFEPMKPHYVAHWDVHMNVGVSYATMLARERIKEQNRTKYSVHLIKMAYQCGIRLNRRKVVSCNYSKLAYETCDRG